MPPQLLDDEMSVSDGGPDEVPAKPKVTKDEEPATAEDDEEGDEEEEEYRVETVLKHKFTTAGELLYQIKWLGYDAKSDLTWEPLENLENASEALDEYHKGIGGAPSAPAKKGKGGKRSVSTALDSPAVEASSKKQRSRKSETNGTPSKVDLPAGIWETEIERVTSILEEDGDVVSNPKTLTGLVAWYNGRKTQHKLEVLRRKCPQKLLDYYEQHLVFRNDAVKEEE